MKFNLKSTLMVILKKKYIYIYNYNYNYNKLLFETMIIRLTKHNFFLANLRLTMRFLLVLHYGPPLLNLFIL
jgi:hypothetical protein